MKVAIDLLHEKAVEASKNAYAPYSKFQVGAAVVTEKGQIFTGCNVENASYGGTICAERVAIFNAIATEGPCRILEVYVVSTSTRGHKEAWPPCGFCRQVIAEFASPDAKIHIGTKEKIIKTYTLKELLPDAFTPQFLKT